ncbi:hypothetical protein CR513_02218, partial [Mucuna pruriens]
MEHLPIHLAYEGRVDNPLQYRWVYPFESLIFISSIGQWSFVNTSLPIFNYPGHSFGKCITSILNDRGMEAAH